LIAKKDHACTLSAFARVRDAFPQARLRIAGEGPLLGELQALAGTLGVADAVDWLGFLGPAAMRAELVAAHVFVHPSVTGPDGNREGVPNAMLEAMATGLPDVATRHGGIPEAVKHGQSGILIDERDAIGLADAVCALLANDADRERLGIQAAASVVAHFSRPAALAALEGIYDKVARQGGTMP
jgi:colanic acid/amylovoran biosynthesis glycosyltransferase